MPCTAQIVIGFHFFHAQLFPANIGRCSQICSSQSIQYPQEPTEADLPPASRSIKSS